MCALTHGTKSFSLELETRRTWCPHHRRTSFWSPTPAGPRAIQRESCSGTKASSARSVLWVIRVNFHCNHDGYTMLNLALSAFTYQESPHSYIAKISWRGLSEGTSLDREVVKFHKSSLYHANALRHNFPEVEICFQSARKASDLTKSPLRPSQCHAFKRF